MEVGDGCEAESCARVAGFYSERPGSLLRVGSGCRAVVSCFGFYAVNGARLEIGESGEAALLAVWLCQHWQVCAGDGAGVPC